MSVRHNQDWMEQSEQTMLPQDKTNQGKGGWLDTRTEKVRIIGHKNWKGGHENWKGENYWTQELKRCQLIQLRQSNPPCLKGFFLKNLVIRTDSGSVQYDPDRASTLQSQMFDFIQLGNLWRKPSSFKWNANQLWTELNFNLITLPVCQYQTAKYSIWDELKKITIWHLLVSCCWGWGATFLALFDFYWYI